MRRLAISGAWIGSLVALVLWAALGSAVAQQADTAAIEKRARELLTARDYPAALAEARKLEAAATAQGGPEHAGTARALDLQADVHSAEGHFGEAEQLWRRVLEMRERSLGAAHPSVAATLNKLGNALRSQGRHAEAEAPLKRALAIREQALGADHADVARTLSDLAFLYRMHNRYAEAEPLFQRALAVAEKAMGPNDPLVATILNGMGWLYESQARYADAEALLKRSLAIREQALGPSHLDVAAGLHALGAVIGAQGRYGEAEAAFLRALAIREKAQGTDHPSAATTLASLGRVYESQGRYAESETAYKRALAIREKVLGPDHLAVAWTVNSLGFLYQLQGRYADAEALYQRALSIREKAHGPGHTDVATTLTSLGGLYQRQGRYGEAEAHLKRGLAIREQVLGLSHPDVAGSLNLLSNVYLSQSRYTEAEALTRRALTVREQALGPNHPDVAFSHENLAIALKNLDRLDEAASHYKRAVAIHEQALGPDHPNVGNVLVNLGSLHMANRRQAEAEEAYRRSLTIREQAFGASHPTIARTAVNLAGLYQSQKRFAEAEPLFRRALAIQEETLGANHPDIAETLNRLAGVAYAGGKATDALAYSRKASAAVIAHAAGEGAAGRQTEGAGGLVEQRASYFRRHVFHLVAASRRNIEPGSPLGREAFTIAQWANQSSAAAAVQQLGTRFAAGSGPLADAVRRKQDIAAAQRDVDRKLLEAISSPNGKTSKPALDAMRKEIAYYDGLLATLSTELEQKFPEYAALATPQPLQGETVQKLLGPDEAVVFWLPSGRETYVFALTSTRMAWKVVAIGEKDLGAKVAAFRRGLDVDDLQFSINAGRAELFDLDFAHQLYAALLGPIEPFVKDKRHLLLVPSGPLTGLPFHLLVTEKPAVALPEPKDLGVYRDAAWLLKRHAVSVLPSVASLQALRAFPRKVEALKPLIGFGDPVFRLDAPSTGSEQRGVAKSGPGAGQRETRVVARTRSYGDYWRGAGADPAMLGQSLPQLPDTADELKTVAKRLGASATDILLGRSATEAAVKGARLSDYRVVYFGTHGLVAGDVKGLAEPSLVLTLPQRPSSQDDGLLTASEVAQLKLNADWVVLSACNTAAGEAPGAEALSGLARAFFYAGARALLVSHWTVDSSAATRLTTSTFDIMRSDPAIGRAEAVRRAMLAYLNDRSNPQNAYPAYWGPFSVIGEGAAR
jgi:CHAT domain-containing protein/tetratricopeptide (TPR) repeat protein